MGAWSASGGFGLCSCQHSLCVGCFKSGLPIVNLSSSNPPRWGRLGFGIGGDLSLAGVRSSDVRAPAAHASLSSMPSSTGPEVRMGCPPTGGRDLSGDAELEGRDNHSGERSDPSQPGGEEADTEGPVMRRGEVIGEIMRRSVLGERRDIPQTGDGLIVLLGQWE